MSSDTVKTWLRKKGLGQYASALSEFGVQELADLAYIEDDDLEEIGMRRIHRRKFMKARKEIERARAEAEESELDKEEEEEEINSSMSQIESAMDEQPMLKNMDMATMMSMFSSGSGEQAKLMKEKMKIFEDMGLDMSQMTMTDMVDAMKNPQKREQILKKKMKLDKLTDEQKAQARKVAPKIRELEKKEDQYLGIVDDEGQDVADAVVDASGNQVVSKKRRRRLARKKKKLTEDEYKDMFGSMKLGQMEKMSATMAKDGKEKEKLDKMRNDLEPALAKLDKNFDEVTMNELAELMKDPANKEIFKDIEGYQDPTQAMADARAEDDKDADKEEDEEIMEML